MLTGRERQRSESTWLFNSPATPEEQVREVAAKILETAKNAISFIAAENALSLSQAGPHINSYGNLIGGVYPEFLDDVDKTKKNAVGPMNISHTVKNDYRILVLATAINELYTETDKRAINELYTETDKNNAKEKYEKDFRNLQKLARKKVSQSAPG